jgi:hypothetical protein
MSWRWIAGGDDEERGRVSCLEFRLRAIDIGTELTLVHAELRTEAAARRHEADWAGALDKLMRRLPQMVRARSSSPPTAGRPS